jgi:hypothetical protein
LTATFEAACELNIELVEVRNPFSYWYVNSNPTFDLVLQNSGTCAWSEGTRLVLVSDNPLDWPESWDVTPVGAGEITEIEIQLRAPSTPQILTIIWQLEGGDGQPIGSEITYDLRVELRPTPTPPPTATSPPAATQPPPGPGPGPAPPPPRPATYTPEPP